MRFHASGAAAETASGRLPEMGPCSANRARAWAAPLAIAAAFAVYLLIILVNQCFSGATQAAFDGYPDEPSHYVSGLLVHDYLSSGFHQSPFRYAVGYYTHLPYFAMGYWGPLFYVAEGVWMSVFGVGRAAALSLVALGAAACGAMIFACVRPRAGPLAAFGAGLLFLLIPVVEWSSTLVMTDLMVACLSFAAALAWAWYLDTEKAAAALAFSVLAAAAMLTKNTGGFLAIAAPLAVVISGRLRLVKSIVFWIAPLLIALIYAPWFLITRRFLMVGFDGWQKPPLVNTVSHMGLALLSNLVWLALPALIGVWRVFRGPRPIAGWAAVCIALPPAVFAFTAFVGDEARYLIPAFPPLIVLTIYGIAGLVDRLPPARRAAAMGVAAAVLVACSAARLAAQYRPAPPDPFRPITRFVLARGYNTILVGADAEGPTIADISESSHRRAAQYLVRPSKLLARTNWMGNLYRSLYQTKEEMQAQFDRFPLDVLIVRMNPPPNALRHEVLIRDMVVGFPKRWRLVGSFENPATAAHYAAYEPVKLRTPTPEEIEQVLGDQLRLFHSLAP